MSDAESSIRVGNHIRVIVGKHMHNRLSSLCRTTLLVADNQGSVHGLKLPLEVFDREVQERIASTMRWMRSRWRRHWLLWRWRRRRSHCRWRRKDLLQHC